MKPMVQVHDLQVYYGAIHAIKGVSFEVYPGEIVTLIGANGAGKSTILKTISGLLRPKSGTIEFEQQDITQTLPHHLVQKGIAHCPEGRRIFAQLSVEENLDMGGYVRKSHEQHETMSLIYDSFPRLKERRNQRAGTLSGGEQKMLAMGRSLMSQPRLLMLDEPSMGLAPILVEQIFDMIQKLHDQKMTILLVEQNAQMALSIADRGYVLETGRVLLQGSGNDLLHNELVNEAYLGGWA